MAVTLLQHHRIGRRHSVHDAADIDVDDRVPLVQGEQFGVPAPADARVVEHQVQSAGPVHHIVDRLLHRRCVSDVESSRARRTWAGQVLGGACRRGPVDVGAEHVGADGHQCSAQRRADARAGSGDDRLLAGEAHCAASFITCPYTSG